MDQKILCISGRKQAGKDTCYKFLWNLLTYGGSPWAREAAIKQFYFAEPLKRMCVDILGCPEDKVYGDDVAKNSFVDHLLWENFPVPVFDMDDGNIRVGGLQEASYENDTWREWIYGVYSYYQDGSCPTGKPKTGPMTVREVLQYWGSEIFRRQYRDVWADACIRAIRKSNTAFAVITDCRFANETFAAQKAGGKVIRLSRVPCPQDTHVSETALDQENFSWSKFDSVIWNENMSILEQCEALYNILRFKWGWIPTYPQDVIVECAKRATI